MLKFNYWVITKNTDSLEGKGRIVDTNVAFRYSDDALAFTKTDAMKQYSVMGVINKEKGAPFQVQKRNIVIFNDLNDYHENSYEASKSRLIQSALEKLTEEEKEALGIEEQ